MSRKRISRRKFVGDVGAGLAFTIVPRHVLGRGYRAPSDKLNIACIGVGGMGANDVRGVGKTENIYALCDVDEHQAAQSFAAFPKAKRFKDFRVMLEKEGKSIDAVTVSTPDHVHAVAGMMAMKLGKHTRIQKPLARTIWEVRQLVQAARKYKVATQMGNQGHAEEGTRQIREWVESGAIGTVREVQLWTNRPIWPQALDRPLEEYYTPPWIDWELWLGPAPARPYNPAYAPFKWRGWWDFGTGALGDIACHSMDASFWALDLGYPTRIEPESTKLFSETAPPSRASPTVSPRRGNARRSRSCGGTAASSRLAPKKSRSRRRGPSIRAAKCGSGTTASWWRGSTARTRDCWTRPARRRSRPTRRRPSTRAPKAYTPSGSPLARAVRRLARTSPTMRVRSPRWCCSAT